MNTFVFGWLMACAFEHLVAGRLGWAGWELALAVLWLAWLAPRAEVVRQ